MHSWKQGQSKYFGIAKTLKSVSAEQDLQKKKITHLLMNYYNYHNLSLQMENLHVRHWNKLKLLLVYMRSSILFCSKNVWLIPIVQLLRKISNIKDITQTFILTKVQLFTDGKRQIIIIFCTSNFRNTVKKT